MRRYLVTGGAGFIGGHLAEALAASGSGLRVLDDLSTGDAAHLPGGAELIRADVADAAAVRSAVRGTDGVFHLAAIASVQAYRGGWQAASRTNLAGSVAVFEAAAAEGVPVVHASSAAVYGDNPDLPLAETARTEPISGYGADKLAAEHHAGAMAALGLRAVGLRFFNVYGPRQRRGSPYSGVITIFLDRWASGRALSVYGDGLQSRDFVYVGDVVAALRLAMARAEAGGTGVYNICTGRPVTVLDLAERLGEALGTGLSVAHEPARPGDIRASAGAPGRAEAELGFRAGTGLREGLARTAGWFAGQLDLASSERRI